MIDQVQRIAFHSLYLDRDETLEYAIDSIKRMSSQKPSAYYYDILCRVDQLKEAGELMGVLSDLIKELNPDISQESMFFGITTDDRFRPAALSLAASMKDQPIPPFLDLNPKRKPR